MTGDFRCSSGPRAPGPGGSLNRPNWSCSPASGLGFSKNCPLTVVGLEPMPRIVGLPPRAASATPTCASVSADITMGNANQRP
jgi:hypothetical protein